MSGDFNGVLETTFGQEVHYESDKFKKAYAKFESAESGSRMSSRIKDKKMDSPGNSFNILKSIERVQSSPEKIQSETLSMIKIENLPQIQNFVEHVKKLSDSPTKRTALPPADTPRSIAL